MNEKIVKRMIALWTGERPMYKVTQSERDVFFTLRTLYFKARLQTEVELGFGQWLETITSYELGEDFCEHELMELFK